METNDSSTQWPFLLNVFLHEPFLMLMDARLFIDDVVPAGENASAGFLEIRTGDCCFGHKLLLPVSIVIRSMLLAFKFAYLNP